MNNKFKWYIYTNIFLIIFLSLAMSGYRRWAMLIFLAYMIYIPLNFIFNSKDIGVYVDYENPIDTQIIPVKDILEDTREELNIYFKELKDKKKNKKSKVK